MQLSEHFSLSEFTASNTATKLNIDNTPEEEIIENLKVLAEGMEKVRELLGAPIKINSGFRNQQLNKAVGGSATSSHMKGFAADFICPGYGTPLKIVKKIESSGIKFDQCIQEGTWVHISFDPKMRGQLLTANFNEKGVSYSKGV